MNSCFLINDSLGGGGGNLLSHKKLSVRRSAAIGDVVASLCVVDKLVENGFEVTFQCHPAMFPLLRHHGTKAEESSKTTKAIIDLDGCYESNPQRALHHFSEMFMASANRQLASFSMGIGKPLNCTPSLHVAEHVKQSVRTRLAQYERPWVFVCPRSHAFFARTVPDPIWQTAAQQIKGTKFWLGLHIAPPKGFVDLQIRHIDTLIDFLSVADLMVSVDTGPLHIAAAEGVQCLALGQASSPELHLSDQRDFLTIWPDNLDCLNCQKDVCPKNYYIPPCNSFDPDQISQTANRRLTSKLLNNVSAVISIYKPEVGTLNRCLNQVLPQVDEVVVAVDRGGIIPQGALTHHKIRYVTHRLSSIGYGRKQNFAARHTNGKYLLLLNDDVFLNPDAVKKMMDIMKPQVGIVSNLLRYPDGTIYHAGKTRSPGVRGWSHIDYKQATPTFTSPVELENCCGACVLVQRKAFYDIKGFDEDFTLYAEDDDFALRMRKAGYQIWFTPHSEGIHLEHQSTQKTGNIGDLVREANGIFHRKWGQWLEKNLYTIPGTF